MHSSAMDKVEVPDRGSPSRSVSRANEASVCNENAAPSGRTAARRAAVRDFVDAHGMHRLPSRTQWSVASPFRFLSTNKVMRRALRDQWLDSRRNY